VGDYIVVALSEHRVARLGEVTGNKAADTGDFIRPVVIWKAVRKALHVKLAVGVLKDDPKHADWLQL
jgi:hypothetical protein